MDMAGRSRAKACAIQILETKELTASECKRSVVKQFHDASIKFPIPHRVPKIQKAYKKTCAAPTPTAPHLFAPGPSAVPCAVDTPCVFVIVVLCLRCLAGSRPRARPPSARVLGLPRRREIAPRWGADGGGPGTHILCVCCLVHGDSTI